MHLKKLLNLKLEIDCVKFNLTQKQFFVSCDVF